ncbi:polysaccharide deacetylase family protein [Paenibacillus kobensis]|uniref:polysaccharide deacetylase family protein n=1 Tax=Paenibacillus kobensis TaxID=59841 RepID=UPI000FD7E5FE|nr:polysaccharide deacetylase family protein [Paenibacillus kobensis]
METETIQMIELLSLKQLSARCQIEIAITYTDGTVNNDAIEIDHYTYNQLLTIQVGQQSRIRLSLYPKWDPYQKGYYSTIIRTNGTFSEKLYFACTEAYVQQIKQLKQRPQDAQPAEAAVQPLPAAASGALKEKTAKKKAASRSSAVRRTVYSSSRWKRQLAWKVMALSTALILLMLCRVDVLLFIDKVDAVGQRSATSESEKIESASIAVAMGSQPSSDDEKQTASEPSDKPAVELAAGQQPDKPTAPDKPGKTEQQPDGNVAADRLPAKSETKAEDKEASGYEVFAASSDEYTYKLPNGYVALTFDDGPSAYTKQIVDVLKDEGVAGTFFFVGKNADRFEEEVGYAVEHGMAVGNHSWDHSQLTDLSIDAGISNILKTNKELTSDGVKKVTLFRPPYGLINDELEAQVEKQHMKVIMWNRDPEDWDADTRDEIIEYFKKIDPSGGIYVLHEKKHTVEALPAIIQYLKKQDLKFVIFQ